MQEVWYKTRHDSNESRGKNSTQPEPQLLRAAEVFKFYPHMLRPQAKSGSATSEGSLSIHRSIGMYE